MAFMPVLETISGILSTLPADTNQWVVKFGTGTDTHLGRHLGKHLGKDLGHIAIPDTWRETYNPIGTTLAALRFPREFAVLHLSSDLCLEYMAWRNLESAWRPAVVVTRFDHTKPPGVRSAASRASFTTMVELAESKGYAVAAFDSPFLIFILKTKLVSKIRKRVR